MTKYRVNVVKLKMVVGRSIQIEHIIKENSKISFKNKVFEEKP